MALEPLRLVKRWLTNNTATADVWQGIADPLAAWATRMENNLKQIGLDLNGDTYNFSNTGKATQSSSIIARLDALDTSEAVVGTKNLGLDLTSTAIVKIVASDATDLSPSNVGTAVFNDTDNVGQLLSYTLTANLSVTLTGAHWGLGTTGDYTDFPLWIMLIDDGGAVKLGVTAQGGRDFILSTDCNATASSVTARSDVLVSSTVSNDAAVIEFGWINANFDDTGNAGGEDYWTIQTDLGDINIGSDSLQEGIFRF